MPDNIWDSELGGFRPLTEREQKERTRDRMESLDKLFGVYQHEYSLNRTFDRAIDRLYGSD